MADEEKGPVKDSLAGISTIGLAASSLLDAGNLLRNVLQNPAGASTATAALGGKLFGGGGKEREESLRREVSLHREIIEKNKEILIKAGEYNSTQKEAYENMKGQINSYDIMIKRAVIHNNLWRTSAGLVQAFGLSLAKINETLDVTSAKTAAVFVNPLLPAGGGDSRRNLSYSMQKSSFDVMYNSGEDVSKAYDQLYNTIGSKIASRLGKPASSETVQKMLQSVAEMTQLGGAQVYGTLSDMGDLDEYSKLGLSLSIREEMLKGTFGKDSVGDLQNMYSRMFLTGRSKGLSSAEALNQANVFSSALRNSTYSTERKAELFDFLYNSASNVAGFTALAGGPKKYRNLLQNDLNELASTLVPIFKDFIGENGQMSDIGQQLISQGLSINPENVRDFTSMLETMSKVSQKDEMSKLNKSFEQFSKTLDNSDSKLGTVSSKMEELNREAESMSNVLSDVKSWVGKNVTLPASEFLGPTGSYAIGAAGSLASLLTPLLLMRGGKFGKIGMTLAGLQAANDVGMGGFDGKEGGGTSNLVDMLLLQKLYSNNSGSPTTAGSWGSKLNNFRSVNSNVASMPGKGGSFLRGGASAVSLIGATSLIGDISYGMEHGGSLENTANILSDASMTAAHYFPLMAIPGLISKGILKGSRPVAKWAYGNAFEGIQNVKEGSDIWTMAKGLTDDKKNDWAYEGLQSDLNLFTNKSGMLYRRDTGKLAKQDEANFYYETEARLNAVKNLSQEMKMKEATEDDSSELKGSVDVNVVIVRDGKMLAEGVTEIIDDKKQQITLYVSSQGVLGN